MEKMHTRRYGGNLPPEWEIEEVSKRPIKKHDPNIFVGNGKPLQKGEKKKKPSKE